MEGYQIGTRIQTTDGFKATVRYIGPVIASKNKDEIWLGVEWDDTTRGKHDGSCIENGVLVKYFDCKMGAGSFIKPSKLKKSKSFADAITERYVPIDAPEIATNSTISAVYVTTAKGNQKPIEFVGEMNIRKRQQISCIDKVTIRNDCISSAGTYLKEIASHLIEVDLQENLFWEWNEIFLLGDAMPQLQSLLLHGNKLQPLTEDILTNHLSCSIHSLQQLKRLALNATGINSWQVIVLLTTYLPVLEELYMSQNDCWDLPEYNEILYDMNNNTDMNQIESDVVQLNSSHQTVFSTVESISTHTSYTYTYITGFPCLQVLDLSSCHIDTWNKVISFGKLVHLQQLIVDDNPMEFIESAPPGTFLALKRLSLSSTQITRWTDINKLSSYPALDQLRLTHIPLFKGLGASEVRYLVIGRLPQLILFNGSKISPREKSDAERTYLRTIIRQFKIHKFQLEDQFNDKEIQEIYSQHPLYNTLKKKYEEELMSLFQQTSSSAAGGGILGQKSRNLATELIQITFHNMCYLSSSTTATTTTTATSIEKKVPHTLSIKKVKLLIQQLYQINPSQQVLSLRTHKDMIPIVIEDNEDDLTLNYYGAIHGSDIFIHDKEI